MQKKYMTKLSNNENPAIELADEISHQSEAIEIVNPDEQLMDQSSMAALVSNSSNLSSKSKVVSLIPEYYEFEAAGESVRGIYLDTFEVNYRDNGTGELIVKKAIRFISDKKIYINSGYLLVEGIMKSGIKSGTAIEITYLGKDKNAKKYSVELLN
jgi:hypothetical protein